MTIAGTRPGTIFGFLVERFLPVYPIYLTLWVAAVEAMMVVLTATGPWRPDWDTGWKVLALIAAGAFLRMVDDQKDLPYDTVHNPDRPLVQGRVTAGQLRRAMVVAAAGALACAAVVSAASAAVLAAALAYGLALWWVEIDVPRVRDNPLLNLAAVCPAQFLVTGFIMVGTVIDPGPGWWRMIAVPVVFTAAFLHLEFARKTSRTPAVGDPHSYSSVLGATPSAVVALAFGVGSVLLATILIGVGPALAAIVLPLVSAALFFGRRTVDHSRSWPTVFVIVFYLAIIIQGLLHQ